MVLLETSEAADLIKDEGEDTRTLYIEFASYTEEELKTAKTFKLDSNNTSSLNPLSPLPEKVGNYEYLYRQLIS